MKKRIISIILVVALTASLFPTAHAANPLEYVRKSFWEYVYDFSHEIGNDAATVWNNTIGAFWDGFDGTPEQAYDDYVQDVQDSLGTVEIGAGGYLIPMRGTLTSTYGHAHNSYPAFSSLTKAFYSDSPTVIQEIYAYDYLAGFVFPSTGYLSIVADISVSGGNALSSYVGVSVSGGSSQMKLAENDKTLSVTSWHGATNRISIPAGATVLSNGLTAISAYGGVRDSLGTIFYRAAYYYEPYNYTPNGFTAPIGGSGSRLTNTGINVMGSDNTVYENVSFVDETNNTFYNPATNTTTSFTDWTYDYSAREYTLTTADNTQVTIRYGDDSVVIQEGSSTVNNYYYAAPVAGPEPTPTPPAPTAHVHSWLRLQEASFAATCTTDGKDEYYCADSTCTETHTVNSAAGGHIWVGTGYVPVEYDDEGNVISSQGYTDYRCVTCNERYRQYDGQPPPSGGSGGSHSGSGNIFEIMFSLLADFFGFFVNLLLDFIPNSLRDFFSSITDSSSDVFGIFNRGGQSNGSGAGRP